MSSKENAAGGSAGAGDEVQSDGQSNAPGQYAYNQHSALTHTGGQSLREAGARGLDVLRYKAAVSTVMCFLSSVHVVVG